MVSEFKPFKETDSFHKINNIAIFGIHFILIKC